MPVRPPRHPELEYALQGVIPRAGRRLSPHEHWRQGPSGACRPAAPVWREHGEEPVRLPVRTAWRWCGPLGRDGLVVGPVQGYHANHGATDMPHPGRPVWWLHSATSDPFGRSGLSSALRWKSVASLPAKGVWAAAISKLARREPDAAAVSLFWREQSSAYPFQAPGRVSAVALRSGSLPHAASAVVLPQTGRMEAAGRRQPDWERPAIPEQTGESRTGYLPDSYPASAMGPARVFSRAAWLTPAAWQTAMPLARPDIPLQPFGKGSGGGHWADHASRADRATAELSALPDSGLVSFFVAGRVPASEQRSRWDAPPLVRLARGIETHVPAQAWSAGNEPIGFSFAAPPGGSPTTQKRLLRFGLRLEGDRCRRATSVNDSVGRAGEVWLGRGATIDHPRFWAEALAPRRPRRAVASLDLPKRGATGSAESAPVPTAAPWLSSKDPLRMPGQAHLGPSCLEHNTFWPSIVFADRPPEAVRQPAREIPHQRYLWTPGVVIPAGNFIGLTRALRQPEVSAKAAGRFHETPWTPLPAASWWSPEQVAEARLAAAAPTPPVLPSQWKPGSGAFRMAGPPKADWGRAEARPAEWNSTGVLSPTVMVPACGADFGVHCLGRQFEFGAGIGQARVARTGAGVIHHPERLKLPHLVCRFPKTDAKGGMGMGGFGSSVFRSSGLSREESFG